MAHGGSDLYSDGCCGLLYPSSRQEALIRATPSWKIVALASAAALTSCGKPESCTAPPTVTAPGDVYGCLKREAYLRISVKPRDYFLVKKIVGLCEGEARFFAKNAVGLSSDQRDDLYRRMIHKAETVTGDYLDHYGECAPHDLAGALLMRPAKSVT